MTLSKIWALECVSKNLFILHYSGTPKCGLPEKKGHLLYSGHFVLFQRDIKVY